MWVFMTEESQLSPLQVLGGGGRGGGLFLHLLLFHLFPMKKTVQGGDRGWGHLCLQGAG